MSKVSSFSHCIAWISASCQLFRLRGSSIRTHYYIRCSEINRISLSFPMIFSWGLFIRRWVKTTSTDGIRTSSWWDRSGSGPKCSCKLFSGIQASLSELLSLLWKFLSRQHTEPSYSFHFPLNTIWSGELSPGKNLINYIITCRNDSDGGISRIKGSKWRWNFKAAEVS